MITRITKRGRTYLVFLDTQGEPLPITPRAWRTSIFRRAVATAAALNRTR